MNTKLPIYEHKLEIEHAIREHDTVIITAETGSGKSTQVPQYIYEMQYKVVCTQPRRMACITLAERVADELTDYYTDIDLHNVIGYKTAFEELNPHAAIQFCTDGLQLARGIIDRDDTVLVIDEVHEWNLNIETLIAWVHKIRETGHKIKVVLMSATMDADQLAQYFTEAVIINCSGRLYNVEMHECSVYDTLTIVTNELEAGKNILVFKPGKKEIKEFIVDLDEHLQYKNIHNVHLLPFHAELSVQEQKACFKHYDEPKVIVATNIAQTSLTISDINVVVDDGYEKRVEIIDGVESLLLRNISVADCKQRAGRAGRTANGKYYLCAQTPMDERPAYSTPEIRRLLLDRVILKLASVGIDAYDISFYHQPDRDKIHEARKLLRLLKALDDTSKITDLGRNLIRIPTSVRYAKMIYESQKYGYNTVLEAMKAAAILEVGSLIKPKAKYKVKSDFTDNYFEFDITYKNLCDVEDSDLLAEVQIYNDICTYKYKNLGEEGINARNFFKIKEMFTKLKDSLKDIITADISTDFNREGFVEIIASCMCDQICYKTSDIYTPDGATYVLPKTTCISGSTKWVVGMPRKITYKDRWGCEQFMTLLLNTTVIPKDIAFKYLDKSKLRYEYVYTTAAYDVTTESFILDRLEYYGELCIGKEQVTINKNHTLYADTYEKCKDIVTKANDSVVVIGGKKFEVRGLEWSWMKPFICIETSSELFDIPDDVTIVRTASGKQVEIQYSIYHADNVRGLKQKVLAAREDRKVQDFIAQLPRKSGNIKKLPDMLTVCGEKAFTDIDNHIFLTIYIGLDLDGESAYCKRYSTKEDADKATTDVCKFFVGKYAKQKYPEKKIIERIDGKKTETKRALKIREDWRDYIITVVENTTPDNFSDNLIFLDDVYADLTKDLCS